MRKSRGVFYYDSGPMIRRYARRDAGRRAAKRRAAAKKTPVKVDKRAVNHKVTRSGRTYSYRYTKTGSKYRSGQSHKRYGTTATYGRLASRKERHKALAIKTRYSQLM